MSEHPPRGYGLATGIFVVVAGMVGAGILTSSGYTLRETGNAFGLLILWAVGGLMALCGAWCVVEMATAFPKVGGDYVFAREAFGPVAGLVVGWLSFLIGFAAPTAVVSRLAANYATKPFQSDLQALLPESLAIHLEPALATLIIVLITWGHCLGQKQSAWVQTATTVAKIVVVMAMGLAALASPQADWGHFSASHWPDRGEWSTWAVGLIYVGYAYAGWNAAGYLAGEIRDPRRLLPLSTLGGCAMVTSLYLLLNMAYIVALDPEGMRQRSVEEVGPVADLAMRHLFGGRVANLLSVVLGIGLVASVSSYLLAGSRLPVAMARDGYLFRGIGRLHPTRQTPILALGLQCVLAVALCWSGTFLQILDYTSVGLTVISAMVVCSIFPLRRRAESVQAIRCPWHPLPALVFLGLSVWTIAFGLMDQDKFLPTLLCLVTVLAVTAMGGIFYRRKSAPPS
jgi:APA family basic amino acid/polyamine antiporter